MQHHLVLVTHLIRAIFLKEKGDEDRREQQL
jgi:hypothetical protein